MNEIIYGIFKVQYDFALKMWFSIFWHYLKTTNNNFCCPRGFERLSQSKDTLKACFEIVSQLTIICTTHVEKLLIRMKL